MSNLDNISVVVRSFNSARTLDAVFSRMSLMEGDELIVVDSGSTDTTLKIAERHGGKIVKAEGPFNYSKSLNLGFQAARNPWVLVISSHCIPVVTGFLDIYRREIANLSDDTVVGYAPSSLSGKSDRELDGEHTTVFAKEDYPKVARVCGNGNSIYRRSAWVEVPFDETVRTAEDKLWIMEMTARGYRFAYIPAARGVNKSQASLGYMFMKGYSDARALRSDSHKPMSVRNFAGALKSLAREAIRDGIGWSNWSKYSAHICGQFVGTHRSQNNTPSYGK
jgi:glycosyltransferase involved in cell wall biosynthesis